MIEWMAKDLYPVPDNYMWHDSVIDVLEKVREPHRSVLEAYYYERATLRDIADRFTSSAHPGSGEWALEKAKRAFRQAWIEMIGELE